MTKSDAEMEEASRSFRDQARLESAGSLATVLLSCCLGPYFQDDILAKVMLFAFQ